MSWQTRWQPEKIQTAAERRLSDSLGKFASEIENTAKQINSQTGWKYGGIDLSPAPLKDVSIGGAIEKFYGAPVGSSGTLTVASLITRALKKSPSPTPAIPV